MRRFILTTLGFICLSVASSGSSPAESRSLKDREDEIRDLKPGSFLTPLPWHFYCEGYAQPIRSLLDHKLSRLRSKDTSPCLALRLHLRLELAKVRLSQAANWEGAAKELANVRTDIAAALESGITWSVEERRQLADAHDEALYLSSVFQLKQRLKLRILDRPAAASIAGEIDAYIRSTTSPFVVASEPGLSFLAFLNERQSWGASLLMAWALADYESRAEEMDASPASIQAMEILSRHSPFNPWTWLYLGMLQFDSGSDRHLAGSSFDQGVDLLETWFTKMPELQSLAGLTRADLVVLRDPRWLCEPYGDDLLDLMTSQYLTDVGGIAGYRARLMRTEIKFGIPDVAERRGWTGPLARELVWASAMPDQVTYDVGGTSDLDTMRYPALSYIPMAPLSSPTVTIAFTGRGKEQQVKTFAVYGRGSAERLPSRVRMDGEFEQIEAPLRSSLLQFETIRDEIAASERRAEREPQWWENAIPHFVERTSYQVGEIGNDPVSTITCALVLPSQDQIPPELSVALTILDARGDEVAAGTWNFASRTLDTHELRGFDDVFVSSRQLPPGQVALTFDIMGRLPSGKYSGQLRFDDGDVTVGASMGAIEVDPPRSVLQLGDIQIMLRDASGIDVINPVGVVWKQDGVSELTLQASLYNLAMDEEQTSRYQLRYALFSTAGFYESVRPLLQPEVASGRGAELPIEALSFAAGGRWLNTPPALVEITPEYWVTRAYGRDGEALQLEPKNSGVAKVSATLDISSVSAGDYILVTEGLDEIARAVTHRLVGVEIAEPNTPLEQPDRRLAAAH